MRRKDAAAAEGRSLGVLARLRADTRGNTLAIMAAMLVPLAGLAGGAVDMARTYGMKTRLQQACDAGVLAGRKAMLDSDGTILGQNATTQAQNFFKSNFHGGWMDTSDVKFTPTKVNTDQVQGVATAKIPMTLMRMFDDADKTVTVTCEARYDVPDADIMFVLDTTGSMAEVLPNDGKSKIDGLREAVMDFFKTVRDSSDPTTHVRYGFMPYSSAANVGGLLPRTALVDKWYYQTRQVDQDVLQNGKSPQTVGTYPNTTQTQCDAYASRSPATGYNSDGSAIRITSKWTAGTCVVTREDVRPQWRYGRYVLSVSQYIDTLKNSSTIQDPSKLRSDTTARWAGCVEERETTVATAFDPKALPPDLDPDLLPVASVDSNNVPTVTDTRWRPMFPEVIYARKDDPHGAMDLSPNNRDADNRSILGERWPGQGWSGLPQYGNLGSQSGRAANKAVCGKPAQRLMVMTEQDVHDYVYADDFVPMGTTFHDVGMIWGTRLISPTGLFASDTAKWPGHDDPKRYIVFMTDGEMNADRTIYGMYGLEYYDQRTTGTSTDGNGYHNARFLAACTAAKNRNITVFVIGFGQQPNASLKSCASPNMVYYAQDTKKLKEAFKEIAGHIAMLRLSK